MPFERWMAVNTMVPLKERMNQFFMEINIILLTIESIAQTIDDCKFSRKDKYSTLQRVDECHSFCDKNRYPTSKDGCLQPDWRNK